MVKSLFRLFIPIIMIVLLNISSYVIDLEKNLFIEYSFLKAYEYIQLFLHSMIILSIGFFVTRFSTLFIFGYILKKRLAIVIPKFLIQLYDLFIFLIILIIILNTIFKVPLTGILAATSAIGVALAFGLRDLLADIFAGIAINIEKPFLINDAIELENGLKGIVYDITWKSTYIKTVFDTVIAIPNSKISSMILTNYYKPEKYYQVRDNFYLSYSIPTSKAKRIILSVLESENLNLTSPDVSIHITNIDTRGVNYSLTYYCTDLFLERIMRTKILTKIIDTLKESNIEPTYQKVDLITKNERNNDYSIDKSQFLKQIELFKTLDEDLLFLLSSKLEESFYKENTVIIEEGDIESTSLFIIVEGLLTVNIKDKTTGNNIQISKLESRNYFGEFSLLTDKPRSATVISKTDVILFEIKKEDIFDILHNNPSLLEYLSEILTNRQLGIKNSIELLNKKMLNEQKNMKETILNRMKKVFNY